MKRTTLINYGKIFMNKENKKISVIIPCYNCSKSIGETLSSLEKQVFRDFSIICVNDGSTDSTLKILEKWQKKGTIDIQIINQKNCGVSKARNAGILASKTEYIVFCDSDDLYSEYFLSALHEAIEKSKADTAYCYLSRKYKEVFPHRRTKKWIMQNQTMAMKNLLFKMGMVGFCCYIYKKDILNNNSLLFDTDTAFGEDREFIWKYLCKCRNAAFLNARLYWYRTNSSSATKKKATWKKTDVISAVRRVEKYMEAEKCDYLRTFRSYMYARCMWSVAKDFAVSKDSDLFERLKKEYDVKKAMKRTSRDRNLIVALSSIIYLIKPNFFFRLIGLKTNG